ncbi:molybdopterin molybdochelatase [Syntrophus gentianae]|uniref:Molybdopterin molybdenumtransferase n=1 Tax=Syntrophus gentianae TaxID=43775 RepID=A0A1H7YN59_9BACT|nr:gephyrin-like molybdotransferase Glp [Syntrophus gentianae]SEM47371.1 molybdopterin molybdochelatase [Syntrophus gentianae]
MIQVEDALNVILKETFPLGTEKVAILDALGRVLGESIFAGRLIPPRDNSSMDGYAVHEADTKGATPFHPVILDVIEDIPAGSIPRQAVGIGQAARIMTGAPIPEGADAVIKIEDTRQSGKRVELTASVKKGENIRRAGGDVREGEEVIPAGTVVRPAEVGMMAALGKSFVSVYQRPVVAVIATGDELADIDDPVSSWKIVNSNAYSLTAQILDCGAIPLQMGIARDNPEDLLAKFRPALRADVILSSGGVSVGDYDLVKDIITEVGTAIEFWRVAMKPGKPLVYGRIGGKPIFGLPGNPVSTMVSFEQFVRPVLLKMMGQRCLFRRTLQAILLEGLEKQPELTYFVRVQVKREGDGYVAVPTGEQSSGVLKSMVRANGLAILPKGMQKISSGERVTVQMIDDSFNMTLNPEYLEER